LSLENVSQAEFGGYSRDQFYRRIRWLRKEGELAPLEGAKGKILLTAADVAFLEELRAVETAHPDWSLATCLADLRRRREQRRAEELAGALVARENELRGLSATIRRLVKQRRRRWWSGWWKTLRRRLRRRRDATEDASERL
jgi:hypothetical protein